MRAAWCRESFPSGNVSLPAMAGSGVSDEQEALRRILEGTASEIGENFFRALVDNLARVMGTYGAWVTEYLGPRV